MTLWDTLMQQKQIQNDRIDQIEKLNRSAQKQKMAEILKAQMENKKKIEQLQLIQENAYTREAELIKSQKDIKAKQKEQK